MIAKRQMGALIMKTLIVYLSGGIKKNNSIYEGNDDDHYWTYRNKTSLAKIMREKNIEMVYLDPSDRADDLNDVQSLFGRDLLQVYLSDCVLVDAREKRGIGIGYEIAFANQKKIPVITWSPIGSYYRPSRITFLKQRLNKWTHPFINAPSQIIVDDICQVDTAIDLLPIFLKEPISCGDYALPYIQRYISEQLPKDGVMIRIVRENTSLAKQIDQIRAIKISRKEER
ncbi:conserved hypothetical protein [Gammaproteobacteria bacterium]